MVANHDGPNTVCLTQVNDVPLVHVLDPLADLPHVVDDLRLAHGVALAGDLLEQLAAGQAGEHAVHQTRAAHTFFIQMLAEEKERSGPLVGDFLLRFVFFCMHGRKREKERDLKGFAAATN